MCTSNENVVILLLAIATCIVGEQTNHGALLVVDDSQASFLTRLDPTECLELGGTPLDDNSCQICSAPNTCCITESDGSQECEACSTLPEGEICSRWNCITNEDDSSTCSGCGSYLNGIDFGEMICYRYTCETDDNDDSGPCACNEVTYIGADCGACSYLNGELFFDCSALGGPLHTVPSPTTGETLETLDPTNVATTVNAEPPPTTAEAPPTPVSTEVTTLDDNTVPASTASPPTGVEVVPTPAPMTDASTNPSEKPSIMLSPAPTTVAPVTDPTKAPSLAGVDDPSKIPMNPSGEEQPLFQIQTSSANSWLRRHLYVLLLTTVLFAVVFL